MNKIVLTTIALSSILQSCGVKVNHKTGASEAYRSNIVLGKFADVVTPSTFDEKTLNDLPRVVSLKESMTPVKNQGSRGSCTFFSTTALIEAVVKKDMNKEVNFSEEYMNYATKSLGYFKDDEGSNVRYNIYGINNGGLLLESDSTYQPSWFDKGLPCEAFKSTDPLAPATCFSHNRPDAEALKKIIPAKDIKFTGFEKDTNEIIRYLAEEKRPLTLGITVNFNGWSDNGDVVYNEDLRAECLKDESKCGGHSILITGYDLDKKVFFFKNSWGKDWGNEGYGTMTINTLDRYASPELYSAQITKDLVIPEEKISKPVIVSSMSFSQKKEADRLSVDVKAEVQNARGNLIYISSFITQKNDTETVLSDKNMNLVNILAVEGKAIDESYIRAIHYITNPKTDTLAWTDEAPLSLNFMKGTEASVKAQLESSEDRYLRTTIYIHTDTDSWKVLKREYQQIAK